MFRCLLTCDLSQDHCQGLVFVLALWSPTPTRHVLFRFGAKYVSLADTPAVKEAGSATAASVMAHRAAQMNVRLDESPEGRAWYALASIDMELREDWSHRRGTPTGCRCGIDLGC